MKRFKIESEELADKLECLGHFDAHNTVCLKWCHLSIRCAITKGHYEQLEMIEDLFDSVLETSRPQ